MQFRESKLFGLHSNAALDYKWSKLHRDWHNNLVKGAKSFYVEEIQAKDFGSPRKDAKKESALKRKFTSKMVIPFFCTVK
jgi:hypothetical protein